MQERSKETTDATVQTNKRMKIEKPGVGRPLLGPENSKFWRKQPYFYFCCFSFLFRNKFVYVYIKNTGQVNGSEVII